jgi:hypothetical protein
LTLVFATPQVPWGVAFYEEALLFFEKVRQFVVSFSFLVPDKS